MNLKPLAIAVLTVVASAFVLLAPPRSSGQAAGDDTALTALLDEVAAQQAILLDNQTKIDAKLASTGEHIRQARIYASRSR